MKGPRIVRGLLVVAVLSVLGLTLYPVGAERPEISGLCLICGDRGLADAILNVLLFVPLGIGLASLGLSTRRSYLIGALLSVLIEFTQLAVPGRDPSPSDVLFNTLGVVIGVLAARSARNWLAPGYRAARRLALGTTLTLLGFFLFAGYALEVSLPQGTALYGQWTPQLGHLEWYRARVERAYLGPLEIRDGPLLDSDSARSLLRSRANWSVLATAGPGVSALGSLVSIYDVDEIEVALIGPDRDDLVYRRRLRAAQLRLDRPDLRLSGAMTDVRLGDTMRVEIWQQAGGICIARDEIRQCGLGFTLGRGWALFYYPEMLPPWLKRLLDGSWVALLVLPVGYWARNRWSVLLTLVLIAAELVLIPLASDLVPTAPVEYVGALAGFGLGALIRRRLTGLAGVEAQSYRLARSTSRAG